MPKATFVFAEHQFRSYEEIGISAQDPALEAVERLNETAGCEILRLERRGIRAQDRVGLVQAGGLVFEILPKIDAPGAGAEHNLLAMLSYAYAFPLQAVSAASLAQAPGGWFELLTRIFAEELHRQMAAGPALAYISREERLPVLRGRWDLARQSRQPGHQHHFLEVAYEELTADTPLNRVFRLAVEELALVSSDRGSLALLSDLRGRLESVRLLDDLPAGLVDSVHFNRINERFRPAFSLARLFLSGSMLSLRAGPVPAFAFVFEMSRLFERFVAGFLDLYRKQVMPPEWQGADILKQGTGRSTFLAECEGRGVLRLIPDLVVRHKDSDCPLLVADTKYRVQEGGIAREDAYQMLAYLVRMGCRRGLLLYPEPATGGALRRRWVVQSPRLEIFACSLNLRVRLDSPRPLASELSAILRMAAAGGLAPQPL